MTSSMHQIATPTWPQQAPESWWQTQWPRTHYAPLDADVECDVVVVGGGVSGCSTAWHLARAGAHVTLLEARDVASGASGRNGGFLLAGMARRPVPLSQTIGKQRAAELLAMTAEGRDRLFEAAEMIGAGAHVARTGSLRLAVDVHELVELQQEAELIEQAGGMRVRLLDEYELPPHLMGSFLGGLHFPDDGRSEPAPWVRALAAAAAGAGAMLYEHSPACAIHDDAEGVAVETENGRVVRASRVVVATEAWLPGLLPEMSGHVLPYRSQVLAAAAPINDQGEITQVLPHVTWSRRGWDYAQQAADGTLVVGGERLEQMDRLRHYDEIPEDTDQEWIESWIRKVLAIEPDVLARWAGVLSQTDDDFAFLGPLPGRPNVLTCGGWGGAGNVLGFMGGSMVADAVLNQADHIPPELSTSRLA